MRSIDNPAPYVQARHAQVLALFDEGAQLHREQVMALTGTTFSSAKHALVTLAAKGLLVRVNRNLSPSLYVAKRFYSGQQIDLQRNKVLTHLQTVSQPQSTDQLITTLKMAKRDVTKVVKALIEEGEAACTSRDARPRLYVDKAREKDFVLQRNSGAQSTVQFAIKRQPTSVFDLARF